MSLPSRSEFEFPAGFTWGAAAAAYQIEGAPQADGKGPSVWDEFCKQPGAVFNGDHGDTACDHYRRYAGDVTLMKELGLGAYRLSLSWPRLLPQGHGAVNPRGFDFYDRLLDRLLEVGITPWVTLFHWDYPQALQERGGWSNPESPYWFADYAALVGARFGDRVSHFITLNEPQIFLGLGHAQGVHAPGLKLPLGQLLQAGHHSLLAHGLGVRALRASVRRPVSIGLAPVALTRYPATSHPDDLEAARQATVAVTNRDVFNNSWWMDPVLLGHYPDDGLELFGRDAPQMGPNDLRIISEPTDFLGINVYQGTPVIASPDAPGYVDVPHPPGFPHTAFDWPITPQALRFAARFLYERYRTPIYITENGLSSRDTVSLDGSVHDAGRVDFTRAYLLALRQAIVEGADVRGYFHWSIFDNFEWAAGYRERFGLVHVDFQTQKRTPKRSAHWYKAVCQSNGAALEPAITQAFLQNRELA